MQNTCSITNFLLTSLTTCSKSKIKNTFKVNWMKLWRIFFLTNVCFLMWSIKSRCKIINKKKIFLWQEFLLRECLCVGNVSITHRGHLFYFHFRENYWLFTDFKVIFHVPIWVLLILGGLPLFRSNWSEIRPWWQIWFLFYK